MTDPIPAADRLVATADNRPALVTLGQLAIDHRHLVADMEAIEQRAIEQPDHIGDDETQGALQDVVKELDARIKTLETIREGVKAPYLTASRIVDGFFKQYLIARLDVARERLARIGGDYLRRKDAAERARREAEARRLREDESKRRAEAEAAAQRAKELQERNKPSIAQEITANTAQRAADAIGSAAWEMEQLARAKSAELARTRSDQGSLGTLQSFWNFEIVDLDAVDKSALWPYLDRASKERAVRAYIRSNAPKDMDTDWQPLLPAIRMIKSTRPQFR